MIEQRWKILRQIDLQKIPILAKKKKTIIFSGEAHFDLGGYAKKQNCRIWGTENPHADIEKSKHPKRVTVWCGFWSRSIIGLFFFKNEQGEAVTVNDDRYRAMLNEFLFTKIEAEDIGNIWFQQDGATSRSAEATLDVLRPTLGSGSKIDLQKMSVLAKKIIFSDEAHFDLGRCVNMQKTRMHTLKKLTHPKRVTVWCGFWSRGIIGKFFFENEQGEAVTINVHKN